MKELHMDEVASVNGGIAYSEGSVWVVATGLYACAVIASGGGVLAASAAILAFAQASAALE